MYNVLSIDLDYISEPYIQLFSKIWADHNVDMKWDEVFNDPCIKGSNFDINPDNLVYALDIFSIALAKCKNVAFGVDHSSILYELKDKNNLNIVNIDHHHDIMYDEYINGRDLNFNIVAEGTWVEYLRRQGSLQNYEWIRNENSMLGSPSPLEYSSYLKDDYQFEMEPDLIYVCLSPCFVPKFHWFYFKIFINLYKAFYEGEVRFHQKPHTNCTYQDPMRGNEDFLKEL